MATESASLTTDPASALDQRSYERAVVMVTALGHILCHMGMTIFPGVLIAIRSELQLASHHVTALALLGYVLMGLGALPVGIWVDLRGPSRPLSIYFFLMAFSGLLLACTTGTIHLFIGLTLLGLAASIYHPVGLAMISLHVRDRGKAMGINGVAGNFGIAGGPAIGMLAVGLGMWRIAYAVLAILSLLAAGLMLWLMRNQSTQHEEAPASDLKPSSSETPRSWKRFLPVALLLGAMTLAGFNYRSLLTGLPVYISGDPKLKQGVEKLTDPSYVFLVLLVGGFGQYLGGLAASRFGGRVYLFVLAFLVPLAVMLAFLEGMAISIILTGVFATFLFALQPVENLLLAEWTTKGRRGVSYGTKFALTFGLGAIGAQFVGAVLTRYHRVAPVFFGIAASGCVMVILIILALVARSRQQASAS